MKSNDHYSFAGNRRLRVWLAVGLVLCFTLLNLSLLRVDVASSPSNTEIRTMANDEATIKKSSKHLSWDPIDARAAIDASTEILYRESKDPQILRFWKSQDPPTIYIYNTIPSNFSSVEHVSNCVDRTFLGNMTQVAAWQDKKGNCLWRPRICDDQSPPARPKQKVYFSYRSNYNMDVAYLDKFYRYPFRTDDPLKADIFIVPYPHKSHCLCHKDFKKRSSICTVGFGDINANVLQRLHLWSGTTASTSNASLAGLDTSIIPYAPQRHLFFHGADWFQQLKPFRIATRNAMSLSLGPVSPCENMGIHNQCGHVTLPYLSTGKDYQPFSTTTRNEEENWTPFSSEERKYFVGAVLGSPKGLPQRQEFLSHWKEWIGEAINGKSHNIVSMGRERTGRLSEAYKYVYRNSTVCLVLPGDGCAQKRFFDAILNGCIPLVPLYESNEKNWPHSFHYRRCSTRLTYPFSKGTFVGDPDAGFDIMKMVVTYNGTCGLACMKGALAGLASNSTSLSEKRQSLKEYAPVIQYGLDHYSDTYPDVFSSLIVRLRHDIWNLLRRTPNFNTTANF